MVRRTRIDEIYNTTVHFMALIVQQTGKNTSSTAAVSQAQG